MKRILAVCFALVIGAVLAQVKISDLPAASTPLVGTEAAPFVQGTTTVKITADQITNRVITPTSVSTGTVTTSVINGTPTIASPTITSPTITSPTVSNGTFNTPTFVAPALGTPSSGVATNLTGTASGLTAGNVTTNANLTGPITSVGNATSIGAQTGTGNTFVMSVSPSINTATLNTPTFVAPALGTPSSGVATNLTGTASGLTVGTATNVVTNANLTGPITSVGNATSIAAQTGTGTTFTMSVSPTLSSPTLNTGTLNTSTLAGLTTVTGSFRLPNGTSTAPSLNFDPTNSNPLGMSGIPNNLYFIINGVNKFALGSTWFSGPTGAGFGWSSGSDPTSGIDTGLMRNAAGVVEVNSGAACSTAANCRDLKVRNLVSGGTAPTVAGSCGSSPSITGGDLGMIVTAGTGSPTSCQVTFGTAKTNAPSCTANASATTTALNVATTTSTVTISAVALTASEKLHVHCITY